MSITDEKSAFQIEEPVVAELFRILTYDNIASHGSPDGGMGFFPAFEDGRLLIDVSNLMNSGVQHCGGSKKSHGFSTGLGLGDLRAVCKLRCVSFTSGCRDDGLWHSAIRLSAARVKGVPTGTATPKLFSLRSHLPKHVLIVDDMPSILKSIAFKFKKALKCATIDGVHIHTNESYQH